MAEAARAVRLKEDALSEMLDLGLYGIELRPMSDQRLERAVLSSPPLGRVVQWYSEAEILENDGEEGRRLWITLGSDVYDITGKFRMFV